MKEESKHREPLHIGLSSYLGLDVALAGWAKKLVIHLTDESFLIPRAYTPMFCTSTFTLHRFRKCTGYQTLHGVKAYDMPSV